MVRFLPLPTFIATLLLFIACGSQQCNAAEASKFVPPAPQPIFDGNTLTGWQGDTRWWHAANGVLVGEIPAGRTLERNEFLSWDGEAHDFDLTLEFRLTGPVNSGIQYRAQQLDNGDVAGYQADIGATDDWLGLIYDEHGRERLAGRGQRVAIAPDGRRWVDEFADPASFDKLLKPGEWNRYRITATASHVEIRVNDRLTAVLDDRQDGEVEFSGLLALQLHAGDGPAKVEFRNVELTRLGETDLPPTPPAAAVPAGARADTSSLARLEGGQMRDHHDSAVLWHLLPNRGEQSPIANAKARALVSGMLVTDGFRADLVSAEPLLSQPIAFAFDERGRIWVAEAYSYPSKQPEGEGKDRIIILEDQDNDGAFETRKVFIEKLNLVSGLAVGMGGVWIGAAPELLFIPDRDRDDRPDGPAQVLLDGWGYQDTHETLNSFTWGPDGWLYGNQGVFIQSRIGKPGTPDAERLPLSAGIWRYHPIRHEFEIFATGGSNQWGLDFNSDGHLFMTHCRSYIGGGGTSYVIRNGHYWNQNNVGYEPFIASASPDFAPGLKNFLPASARYDSGEGGAGKKGTDVVYGGHAHTGTMVYLGDNWPDIYRNQVFTHNIFGRQLNRGHNVREGAGYETFDGGYDLMFTPDPTYLGVSIQYGPDGAAYISDWADLQQCHSPQEGAWDRSNGRIYRLAWSETWKPVSVNLATESDAALVALLAHKNAWYGRTARRLLQERAANGNFDAAARRTLEQQAVESSDRQRQLDALWTLHVTGSLDSAGYEAALASPHEVVRAWVVHLGTEQRDALQLATDSLLQRASRDPSQMVRLAIASALPMFPTEPRWDIATALAAHADDANDRFLPKVLWSGLAPLIDADPERALELAASTPIQDLADSIRWSTGRTPAGRDALTAQILESPPDQAARSVRIMAFALQQEAALSPPAAWPQAAQRLSEPGVPEGAREATEQLSVLFGDEAALARARARLADDSLAEEERLQTLQLLKQVGDTASVPIYLELLDQPAFRSAVIPLLATTDDPAIAQELIERYPTFSEEDRAAASEALVSRPKFALALLEAVGAGTFDREQLSAFHVRQLNSLQDPQVEEMLGEVWGRTAPSSSETEAAETRYMKLVGDAPMWAYSMDIGQDVFVRACGACHVMDGAGTGQIGPNLTGSSRHGNGYFVESIVDPNAVVGLAYQLNLVTLKVGSVVSGMVDSETGSALVLRTLTDRVTVQKDQIARRDVTPQSMMPPGLLDTLSSEQVIHLFKFLTKPAED